MSASFSDGQNFLLGTIAAAVSGAILQPTLYWKNARAQSLPFILTPSIVYRGTTASIINESIAGGVQFLCTGWFRRILDKDSAISSRSMRQIADVGSAVLGGLSVSIISCPVELVMIQQQRYGGSFLSTQKRIISEGGIFGAFRGLAATAGREAFYVAAMLGITPMVQEYLIEQQRMSLAMSGVLASTVGGVLAALPSNPFDVVKTCQQGDIAGKTYKGALHTIGVLLKNSGSHGISRLFYGGMWRMINVIGTVYLTNECRVRLSPFVGEISI